MDSRKLLCLLPADFSGGTALVFGADSINRSLVNAVCEKADRLIIITGDGESTTNFDGIQLNSNCQVERMNKKNVNEGALKNICSLVIFNGVVNPALSSFCMSCLQSDGYVMLITKCFSVQKSFENKSAITTYTNDQIFKATPMDNSNGFVFVASRTIERFEDGSIMYCSVFKKVLLDPAHSGCVNSLQDVLNDTTYTKNILQILDRIFSQDGDPGFISTGGAYVTEECLKQLDLQPGQRVLDVGCGAGGPIIQTARKYNVHAVGVDISTNMIDEAESTISKLQDVNIDLEVCDIERREFPDGYFDAIYSKDVILHIVKKQDLFKKFLKWLKPGGKLLITDYCRTDNDFSDIMLDYMKQRANVWFLITHSAYGKLFQDAGFVNVNVQDKHDIFRECIVKESVLFAKKKDDLLKDFDHQFVESWYDVWKKKLRIIDEKELTWGVFYGEKPQE